MRKNNCELIRRELDELMLDEASSSSAVGHLRECSECREFHQKQTRLRQIVGSLGTVAAPPDFDFRLRARLANDSSSAAFHLRSSYWPFGRRGFAVAMLLLLFATGIVLIRNVVNGPAPQVATGDQRPAQPAAIPVETTTPKEQVKPQEVAVVPSSSPQKIRNERPSSTGLKPRRSMVSVDLASEGATVINGSESVRNSNASAVFPIDASLQSFTVSLDDGRGNARTISVPTISFGSQRMAPVANQFAQKRDW